MLKSKVSSHWQALNERSLMTLALDVVESLYGPNARNKAEARLLELELELARQLEAEPDANALLDGLYRQLGVVGDWERFFSIDNALMDRVLERSKGLPVTLGILLLHLCDRHRIRAEGICFPGHFLVRLWQGGEPQIVDPFTGQRLDSGAMDKLLRGTLGNLAKVTPEHLKAADKADVLERLINVTKAAFLFDKQFSQALACSQLLLLLKPDCPYEIRDRGFLFEQLDCAQLAAKDFEFFIQHCPDDPIADVLQAQIAALDLGPHTLH
ncbi:SirB1 family protein [Zobellella maritima]|uniref:SirB1 family protein n=1 Tax=Zobellella maritima TaxID=2059725 RepID=UPI000E301ACE|nr:tetratricopeptide repeat protein [Zobellella maritima]